MVSSIFIFLVGFLTHWGRVTHICVGNLTIIGQDNGLSPGRRQAIIWTNAGILFIGPWETNFSEILIGIHTFSIKKMPLKMSSAKWRPFCLGLNVLIILSSFANTNILLGFNDFRKCWQNVPECHQDSLWCCIKLVNINLNLNSNVKISFTVNCEIILFWEFLQAIHDCIYKAIWIIANRLTYMDVTQKFSLIFNSLRPSDIYMSVYHAVICLDNGLLPVCCHSCLIAN